MIQNAINKVLGMGAGIATAARAGKKIDEFKSVKGANEGKDLKMAAKSRREAQQKINAIMANKEISSKARTRRIGKVLDEYNEGGN